jgi:hypothetical protein
MHKESLFVCSCIIEVITISTQTDFLFSLYVNDLINPDENDKHPTVVCDGNYSCGVFNIKMRFIDVTAIILQ